MMDGTKQPGTGARSLEGEKSAQPIYEELRRGILQGVFPPDTHLVEWSLAKQFDVSRTPVRVALARLEGDGLVRTIPNRGAFVSDWLDVDYEEIYALRIRLEPYACRLAASRISFDALNRLDAISQSMVDEVEGQRDGWVDRCTNFNAELHGTIIEASESNRLISILRSLTELLVVRRSISLYPRQMLRRNVEQHFQIVQALRQRDPEWAEALMTAHIMGGRQAIAQHLAGEDGSKAKADKTQRK